MVITCFVIKISILRDATVGNSNNNSVIYLYLLYPFNFHRIHALLKPYINI